ncbi:D-sedoheptulose 7-phosphate isomerase [Hathewaya massiliensis]|uniref:D-sedoheptulose 7-phosphate isomerase n=1 Tax=Hathewaya massiliensis TaxID=1964382 RepID=UPI00163BABAB|nr:D-sedoheptulose 7-phosphate isomerase [Hathewaya massiliensis]
MIDLIKKYIHESIEPKKRILEDKEFLNLIENVANVIIEAFKRGNKVLVCGNGGSAADSQHMVGEFVSKFRLDRKALPAIALTTNSSILTSIGNDYEYKNIFERQVEALGNKGDILIGISTSGNSENITLAFKKAHEKGLTNIGLLGRDGGENKNHSDISIIVPSNDTARIQESHILIEHILCDLVEQNLFGTDSNE